VCLLIASTLAAETRWPWVASWNVNVEIFRGDVIMACLAAVAAAASDEYTLGYLELLNVLTDLELLNLNLTPFGQVP
jgi:hypothetical protein